MTEEEKQAIRVLKHTLYGDKIEDSQDVALDIVLNLVEKQQKEIQKLKEKLLDVLKGKKVIEEETPQYIKENYIPKSKIEEKIEQLEDVLDLCVEEKIAKYKIKLLEEEIDDFKELLESEE